MCERGIDLEAVCRADIASVYRPISDADQMSLNRSIRRVKRLEEMLSAGEVELTDRVQQLLDDGLLAQNELVERTMPWARKLAWDKVDVAFRKNIPMCHLEGEANVGLTEAARAFDPRINPNFMGFAKSRVKKAISDYLFQVGDPTNPKTYEKDILRMVRVRVEEEATAEEIAWELGFKDKDGIEHVLAAMEHLGRKFFPAHHIMRNGDEVDLGELMIDKEPSVEEQVVVTISVEELRQASGVSDRDWEIYCLRVGEEWSLRDLADRYGLSYESIRLIEKRVLDKIRAAL